MLAAQGSLMAIDLGSEYLKVCLVKPGRTPISIVVNEMSRRKSPALVGIVEEERVLGEEASSLGIRYPNLIFSQLRNLLGRSAGDAEVQRLVQQNLLPYTVVDHPERGTAALQVNETTSYLVEELVVSGTKAESVWCSSRQYTAAVANSAGGCSGCCAHVRSCVCPAITKHCVFGFQKGKYVCYSLAAAKNSMQQMPGKWGTLHRCSNPTQRSCTCLQLACC